MALYQATITKDRPLADGEFIESWMTVQFTCTTDPWTLEQGKPINDAFRQSYDIDLRENGVLNRMIVRVEKVK